jgi:enoyl-CoA hydratase
MADAVLAEVGTGVTTLTLNRPERHNAITPELVEELLAALRGRRGRRRRARRAPARRRPRRSAPGYDIGWGAEAMAASAGPWDPIADLALMRRFVDAYMALWRSPKPVIAQVHGALRRRRHRPRAVRRPHRLRRGLPDRLRPGARVGLAHDRDVDVPLGLERCKRLLLTGDPVDGRRGRVGAGLGGGPADELEAAARALAERVALLPANQLHMMKAARQPGYEQMGLRTTQLVGHAARRRRAPHARGRRASPSARSQDVRAAVAERDGPFGDYGQGRGPRRRCRRLRRSASSGRRERAAAGGTRPRRSWRADR